MINDNHILVVNGMGGLGKSTIANALSLLDIGEYSHLIWLNISHGLKKSIISNRQLIENLKLTDRINKIKLFYDIEKQDNEVFDLLISAIRNINNKSLLVLDDANTEFENEFLLLNLGPNWKIIVTSRNRYDNINTYELPALTKEKAINLFYYYSKISNSNENNKIIEKIVSYVWYHTLSIELLGKTIANSFELTLNKLESLMVKKGLKEMPKHEIKTAYYYEKTKKENIVTSTLKCLQIAFDLANFKNDSFTSTILKHFSLLPSIPLGYEVLFDLLKISDEENIDFQNRLRGLINSGWIVQTSEGLYMHPIIQECVRNSLKISVKNSVDFIINLTDVIDNYHNAEKANLTLYVAFSKNLLMNFTTQNYSRVFLKFVVSFSKLLNTIGYPREVLKIIDKLEFESSFKKLELEIKFEKAKSLLILESLDDSLIMLTEIGNYWFGKTHLNGELLYHIGLAYKKMYDKTKDDNLLVKAIEFTEESLAILDNLGDVEEQISSSLLLKAQLLRRRKQIDLSIVSYEKAKSLRIIKFGENHFKTATVLLELGVLYNEIKEHFIGIEYTKKAIDILSNYYGDDSLGLAVPYHNYAHCFFVTEQFEAALEYELKCFEILKNNVGIDDTRYQKAERKLNRIKEMMKSNSQE